MKKPFLLSVLLLLIFVSKTIGQRVDLDRFYINVNYQKLPQLVVPENERTFGVRVSIGEALKTATNEDAIYNDLKIYGWQRVEENPKVGIEFTLDDFIYRGSQIKSETTENKDKEGKVISRVTTYWVEASYQGRGNCIFEGPKLPVVEEKKEEPQNMFLVDVELNEEEEDLSSRIPFNINYTYASSKSSSSKTLSEDFAINQDAIYSKYLRSFSSDAVNKVNNQLNSMYGFAPINSKSFLWIQNSKKHEEYETQIQAIEAAKLIFDKMEADKPIDQLANNLNPLISYFQSLKTKYTKDDKNDAKMRYSAFYNLATIYYYLDMPIEMIKEAEGLIANDYDKKDGEELLDRGQKLFEEFKQKNLYTRHVQSIEE